MRPVVTKSSSRKMWFFSLNPTNASHFLKKKKKSKRNPTFSELCSISHLKGFILSKSAAENKSILRKEGLQTGLQLSNTQHGASVPGAFPSPGLYWYSGIIWGWLWLAWGGLCWESQPGSKLPVCFGTCALSVVGWATGHHLHSMS